MTDLVERLRFERQTCGIHSGEGYGLTGIQRLQQMLDEAASTIEALSERIAGLEKALTPSADTSAAYNGKYRFRVPDGFDEFGDQYFQWVDVPWATIKEIMEAIRTLASPKQQDRSRTAAYSMSANNSELEPDDRQKQGSGNTDRQGSTG